MILAIADALTATDVAEVRARLASAAFIDGKTTAGWSAKLVKANLQAADSPGLQRLRKLLQARLVEHATFALATRPKTILGPLFSRYEPGHAYGDHVDDALIGGLRTDVSFTLFLSAPESYGGGELVIDEPRRAVQVRGAAADLTPTEWGVLVALATVPGRVYSRFELINRVRGYEFEGYERTIDSHVKNLRRKIEEDPGSPHIVQTVLGGGYRLGLARDD